MAIEVSLSGTLTVAEDGTTLTTKSLSLSQSDLDDYKRRQRLEVAVGTTEVVDLPAINGEVLAIFLREGGPITLNVGDASDIPVGDFFIMDSPGFTSLSISVAGGAAAADVEIIVGGTD